MSDKHPDIFCIGMAKTGTLSMANIWGPEVRTGHEPEPNRMITLIRDKCMNSMSQDEIRRQVSAHIERTNLQIHASQLNYFILNELLSLYPDAKFILTIREPYAWLNSMINHQLSRRCNPEWEWLREYRFRSVYNEHPPEEDILRQLGLFTLDGYLHYWNEHNITVINKVPAGRLLIIRTDQLPESLTKIASFVNNPALTDNMKHAHLNIAVNHWSVLEQLESGYLDAKILHRCEGLVRQFFQ